MNSELYGKEYIIPENILSNINKALIQFPNDNGIKRAKYLLNNKKISYSNLKRIKNFFDYNTEKTSQYLLYGGDEMKSWVEKLLNSERQSADNTKEIKKDLNIDIDKGDINTNFNAKETIKEENENFNIIINSEEKNNAIALIFNNDKKILLLKRNPNIEWYSNKWSLVGGGIEVGETPEFSVKREIYEETGLKIENLIQKFIIERNKKSKNIKEYVFVGKFNGNEDEIKLNTNENINYGFFSYNEIKFLDTVPNLIDYIDIAIKDYS